ncbi:MAG TPA: energy transducer TonB [Ferruginibacter sp.]|nr:energy transducer TonB [Ferruginibacter sp.]
MNSDLIMKSDVLDIIFENRNKAYGAYELRKFYTGRLYKSIGIMMGGIGVLFCLTFFPKKKNVDTITFIEGPRIGFYCPKAPPPTPPIPQKNTPKPNRPTHGAAITLVKDSTKKIPDSADLAITTTSTIPSVSTSISSTIDGAATTASSGTGEGKSSGGIGYTPAVNPTIPIDNPDVYPSFPGGDEALRKFLEKNLRTPIDMADGEIVSVQISFVVGYDGKLKSFQVVKDGGEDFNNEVIRVLKKMPNWTPGKSKGQNVSVYHIIPVKFESREDNP